MKKRMFVSALGMLVAYSVVASTALAVFSPQAQVGALAFRTSSYSLKISSDPSMTDPATSSFGQSISLQGANNMYPGMEPVAERFWLMNTSSSSQMLQLHGAFSPGDEDWEKLKGAIRFKIKDVLNFAETTMITLGETSSQPWTMATMPLGSGERRLFEIEYSMSTEYSVDPDGDGPLQAGDPIGNEAMGLETTGASFIIDGQPAI